MDLWHWNGLPPNRALRKLRLAPASFEPAPRTPSTWRPTRYRLVVGEIESVVQAHPADKAAAPRAWRTHRYELALATAAHVADDAQSPARPADAPPPPLFEVGAADPDEVEDPEVYGLNTAKTSSTVYVTLVSLHDTTGEFSLWGTEDPQAFSTVAAANKYARKLYDERLAQFRAAYPEPEPKQYHEPDMGSDSEEDAHRF